MGFWHSDALIGRISQDSGFNDQEKKLLGRLANSYACNIKTATDVELLASIIRLSRGFCVVTDDAAWKDVPADIRGMAVWICDQFSIKGSSDPMYICNVIAVETGRGDGKGNFTNA